MVKLVINNFKLLYKIFHDLQLIVALLLYLWFSITLFLSSYLPFVIIDWLYNTKTIPSFKNSLINFYLGKDYNVESWKLHVLLFIICYIFAIVNKLSKN
jgi:hypothetical protein